MRKEYLGDSVYIDFDGFHIVLTTENGMGESNEIFLDNSVFLAIKRYGDRAFKLTTDAEAEFEASQ